MWQIFFVTELTELLAANPGPLQEASSHGTPAPPTEPNGAPDGTDLKYFFLEKFH